ncbi:hypothetical protein H0H92_016060, partial [Tricholoma furcatifolium]
VSAERVSKRSHKRARMEDAARFVDLEAEQSDDDEDDDDDENPEENDGFINDQDDDEESELSAVMGELSVARANDPAWQGILDRAYE